MTNTRESLCLLKLENSEELSLSYLQLNNISNDQYGVYFIYLKYLNCTNYKFLDFELNEDCICFKKRVEMC